MNWDMKRSSWHRIPIGSFSRLAALGIDIHVYELLYRRKERADLQAMQEAARQAVRTRQEAREEAVLQGLRRSERGRAPLKRKYGELWLARISGCKAV